MHRIKSGNSRICVEKLAYCESSDDKAQSVNSFSILRKNKNRLAWFNEEEIKKVAADLGVSEDEVCEMESRMTGQDLGFDLPVGEDDDEAYTPSNVFWEDNSSNFADDLENAEYTGEATAKLVYALSTLDERSQDIIKTRWLDENKLTLHDLAAKYGISAERASLEKCSFEENQRCD